MMCTELTNTVAIRLLIEVTQYCEWEWFNGTQTDRSVNKQFIAAAIFHHFLWEGQPSWIFRSGFMTFMVFEIFSTGSSEIPSSKFKWKAPWLLHFVTLGSGSYPFTIHFVMTGTMTWCVIYMIFHVTKQQLLNTSTLEDNGIFISLLLLICSFSSPPFWLTLTKHLIIRWSPQ